MIKWIILHKVMVFFVLFFIPSIFLGIFGLTCTVKYTCLFFSCKQFDWRALEEALSILYHLNHWLLYPLFADLSRIILTGLQNIIAPILITNNFLKRFLFYWVAHLTKSQDLPNPKIVAVQCLSTNCVLIFFHLGEDDFR